MVAATKREQNLQDVSVAVTALSAEDILNAQIASSEDLTFLVPSLNLQKGATVRESSFSIRGIGTQSFSSAVEPSVSTMLDGVVMGRSGQAFMQLLDVARVEVLRGPQGTLFGKNSTGGVIHIITQDPTETTTGEVGVTAINNNEYRSAFTLSGPVTDSLGYRLSANGSTVDDYTPNFFDGDALNGSDQWSVRGKLRWLPAPTLEVKWAGDYSDRDCDCTAGPIRSLEPFGGNEAQVEDILDSIAPDVPDEQNKDVNVNKQPFSDSESSGQSLEVNWDIGDFTLTSISAVRDFEVNGTFDIDSRPTDVLGIQQFGSTQTEQFTQELRLLSPAAGRLSYVAGLFYFDQTVERTFRREFEIVDGSPGEGIAHIEVDTVNWAAFGEVTWHLADAWRLVLGARYTEDELDFVFGREVDGLGVGLPQPVERTPGNTREDDLSGKVALQWDYSDAGMAYVSFTQGYKGPAFDMTFGTDPVDLQPVAPETSESLELGLKTTLFDGSVRLNSALFYAEYSEFQAQAFVDPDGAPDCPADNPNCDPGDDPGSFVLVNAGEVSTTGLEVDFQAWVSDRLRLSGGAAWIAAEIEEYRAGPCSGGQEFRGECDGLQDLSGGDLPFSPDWKLNLAATYSFFPRDGLRLDVTGSMRAQDEVQYSITQDENTIEDRYAIFNASAALADTEDRWRATVFVKNLTDRFYADAIVANNPAILPNGYNHRYSKMAERTYGLELRYSWF
ncbi:MAG: TonB-dependent receptor [Halioglobus sp.]|nr:TonB-dependent receptor [Halioglobus sp.]